eukprot:5965902-Prymnesium_polylepis.1
MGVERRAAAGHALVGRRGEAQKNGSHTDDFLRVYGACIWSMEDGTLWPVHARVLHALEMPYMCVSRA